MKMWSASLTCFVYSPFPSPTFYQPREALGTEIAGTFIDSADSLLRGLEDMGNSGRSLFADCLLGVVEDSGTNNESLVADCPLSIPPTLCDLAKT